jgi:hypothetical protein
VLADHLNLHRSQLAVWEFRESASPVYEYLKLKGHTVHLVTISTHQFRMHMETFRPVTGFPGVVLRRSELPKIQTLQEICSGTYWHQPRNIRTTIPVPEAM